jgi:hypothetical protein
VVSNVPGQNNHQQFIHKFVSVCKGKKQYAKEKGAWVWTFWQDDSLLYPFYSILLLLTFSLF